MNKSEHFDVLIIGAGLSGIGAGSRIEASCDWANYCILEARDALGGTWDLFRYPGIRSDSDMFTFSYPFRPWDRDTNIGLGEDILAYIEDTARETGVDKKIRFGHKVVAASWSTKQGRWTLQVLNTTSGQTQQMTCGFLFSCTGYYRYDRGYTPEFVGASDFDGPIIHPQQWPEELEYSGKSIVVIGSGATAITMVPALAETASKVTMLQRSPTYVAALPSTLPTTWLLRRLLPSDQAGRLLRWTNALATQAFYDLCQRWPKTWRKILMAVSSFMLPKGYDVNTHFGPDYKPWDQRLCLDPDGLFFKAIRTGKAEVVTDQIERLTKKGIELTSGELLPADMIVTATGLELLFIGGVAITVDGERVDPSKRLMYRSIMLEGVPNCAVAMGYTNASWTLRADIASEYVASLLNEMRRRDISVCTPRNSDPDPASSESLLGLTSGYVQRTAHLFPLQGKRLPWRVGQRYLTDYFKIKRAPVITAELELSRNHQLAEQAPKTPVSAQVPAMPPNR